MEKKEQDRYEWKPLVLVLVIGLLAGLLGGALSAQLFAKPGPQGEQGPQGSDGPQGPQGIPGVDGADSILQIVQKTNDTQFDTSGATVMQWYNLSDFDSSMEVMINIQQNSKLFAQFSSTQQLKAVGLISVRIVVDNNYNSSTCICSIGGTAAPQTHIPGHIEFLTNSLNAGPHTIKVQFWIEGSSTLPIMLDRTLTVLEIASQ